MKVKATFLVSASDPAHFPESSLPEIAFLGRSNVGKSSLLNSLVGMNIAHVSSTPGRTRAINFFAVSTDPKRSEPKIMFVDLPGYGYAKVSKAAIAEWSKFIEYYLKSRKQLFVCTVVIDLNIPVQKSDIRLLQFLRAAQKNFIVVGTKADKVSKSRLQVSVRQLARELGVEKILAYSAKTGAGRKELWQEISSCLL